ncbi:histidine kinase dimerization/phospho-acceptor domain-containing protein [Devosia sp.]|uniref:sensor histidine kinase n=1 Tax=Devosia sp. TaxID=1871048 RepID=UPI001B06B74E|nr:histidine kinase dimerization/phospho-acceptor domain-containing protein [Devosia sp.]MBO9589361.1 PAS domain-containing protein [Devosia sp.]
MNAEWTTSPNARRVLQHAQDARPAWLWSQDGQRLIWSNPAAALFLGKLKKSGLRLAPLAVPLKGQVARTIRLGSPGRTSLARIQFNAGDKPASATCATTPLVLEGEETWLLIVSVDPIELEILAASGVLQGRAAGEARPAEQATVADEPAAQEDDVVPQPTAAPEEPQMLETSPEAAAPVEDAGEPEDELPSVTQTAIAADDSYARELHDWQDADPETVYAPAEEPAVFTDEVDTSDLDEEDEPAQTEPATAGESDERPLFRSLSALVDRLAADEDLYTPLNEADDEVPLSPAPEESAQPDDTPPRLFKITGRGFRASARPPALEERPEDDSLFPAGTEPEIAHDLVERVSRYNFDELSRILNDRVGLQGTTQPAVPATTETGSEKPGGSLVSLGGETLVLNRLPLGILVFRDQQILFANRAITEMVGYESVEALRLAGLTAIFPASNGEQDAGPVNHLVQRDGTLVPVTARLQSTSWQGRPALMLSASTTEVRTGHEDAVRAFAQAFAELRGDGFVELSRTGVVRLADSSASAALGAGSTILGKPLSALISSEDGFALRGFLERPGRFAETERPAVILRSGDNKSEIVLFAQGQAGIVSGYFAMVRPRNVAPRRALGTPDADPALLARIGRGVRRPLNTIIGFAELLRSKAFGELGDERYEAYAEDIAAAGNDIAALVDELEDYARLREGKYLAERASLDLTELLETCVLRIRNQANAGRIIVRNAISETLPRVTADRASLAQAVLNLLASAIDQSPVGSTVVISAQLLDDGGIAIHVRDNSNHAVDMAERFVVFRDGLSKSGQALAPVRSSVGLALTRSLLAVNAVSLSVDPAGENGVLFSLRIPADLVDNLPTE